MLLWRTYAYCEYLLAIKMSGRNALNKFYYSRYIFGLRNTDVHVRDPGHVTFFILIFSSRQSAVECPPFCYKTQAFANT